MKEQPGAFRRLAAQSSFNRSERRTFEAQARGAALDAIMRGVDQPRFAGLGQARATVQQRGQARERQRS
ncbi:hypothetical protein, partial [Bradyrhizobium sp.]|uniref:hypothetical protein n=1 Tax=Bradyrhizobium sp. TaxID=376 RepID=UPI00391DF86A